MRKAKHGETCIFALEKPKRDSETHKAKGSMALATRIEDDHDNPEQARKSMQFGLEMMTEWKFGAEEPLRPTEVIGPISERFDDKPNGRICFFLAVLIFAEPVRLSSISDFLHRGTTFFGNATLYRYPPT